MLTEALEASRQVVDYVKEQVVQRSYKQAQQEGVIPLGLLARTSVRYPVVQALSGAWAELGALQRLLQSAFAPALMPLLPAELSMKAWAHRCCNPTCVE